MTTPGTFLRASSLLGVCVASFVVSAIVAPQMLAAELMLMGGHGTPSAQLWIATSSYELGLWCSGLAVLIIATRLRWRPRRWERAVVVCIPAVADLSLVWLLFHDPRQTQAGTMSGWAARLAFAVAALWIADRLPRQGETPGSP